MRLRVLFFFVLGFALLLCAACKKSAPVEQRQLVYPVVNDASTGLLLTWIDEKGEFHKEDKVADVPVTARDVVKVNDAEHEPLNADEIFVVDLRLQQPGGNYPVRLMKREEFDHIAVAHRVTHGGGVLAQKSAGPIPEPPRPAVIIYGASWCGPCHQAAAYLKRRNIDFIEKDIESDQSAANEMQAKLEKAGRRGGSIPVIDVRGKIIVGFDQHAVESALGTAL